MEHNDINNFKASVEQLRLTHTEKEALRARVFAHVEHHPAHVRSYFSFSLHHIRAYAMATLLVCLVSGGIPTVFAAQKSLPGELLYPLKVHIIEPIEEAAVLSPERKAEVVIKNAQNRLKETAALIAQDGAQSEDIADTNPNLLDKVEKAKKSIAQLSEKDGNKISLQKDLLTVLETYESLIKNEDILTQDTTSIDLATTADALEADLTDSINTFVSSAEPEDLADALQDNINQIQDALATSTTIEDTDTTVLDKEQRSELEQALIATQNELTDEDTGTALKILIFSNQNSDVIDALNNISTSIATSTVE